VPWKVKRPPDGPQANVCPVRRCAQIKFAPPTTDLLFVYAHLQPRGGGSLSGAVTVRFSEARSEVEGVVLLDPTYCAMGLQEGIVPSRERSYVEKCVANVNDLFPLKYEAVLLLGSRELPLRGVAHLGW